MKNPVPFLIILSMVWVGFASSASKLFQACEILSLKDANTLIDSSLQQKPFQWSPRPDGTTSSSCYYAPKGFNLEGDSRANPYLEITVRQFKSASAAKTDFMRSIKESGQQLPQIAHGGQYQAITGFGDMAYGIAGNFTDQTPNLKIALMDALKGAVIIQVLAWKPGIDPLMTTKAAMKLAISRLP